MKFGIKIVDKSYTENPKKFLKYNNFFLKLEGHELSFKGNPPIPDKLPKDFFYFTQHTKQEVFNIYDFFFNKEGFNEYIKEFLEQAKIYNIKRCTVHLTNASTLDNFNKEQIKEYIKYCVDFSINNNIRIYIENTFNTVNQMEEIFSYDKNKELGFTFDIGHAKCFVFEDTINDWLDLIDRMKRPTHIHFHANNSKSDQHLPITIKTNFWINDFHDNLTYEDIAKKIIKIIYKCEESSFILETHPLFQKVNMIFLEKILKYHNTLII